MNTSVYPFFRIKIKNLSDVLLIVKFLKSSILTIGSIAIGFLSGARKALIINKDRLCLSHTIILILAAIMILPLATKSYAQYLSPPYNGYAGVNRLQSGPYVAPYSQSNSFSIIGGPLSEFPGTAPGFPMGVNPYTNNANIESFPPFGPGGYNIAIAGPLGIPDPPDSIRSVKVKDGYAYLVVESRDTYIWIVDVTDPADPDVIKKKKIGSYSNMELFLHNNYLFWIAQGTGQGYNFDVDEGDIIGVYDISDPESPEALDTLKLGYKMIGPPRAFFTGDLLYIFYENVEEEDRRFKSALFKIDISDPADLSEVSYGEIDSLDEEAEMINQITVKGDVAYLSGGTFQYSDVKGREYTDHLHVLDISDPENPSLISNIEFDDEGTPFRDQELLDNYIVLIGGSLGLVVIDMDDPHQPEIVATLELAGPEQIIIQDRIAYISDHYRGLEVVDLTNPEAPERIDGYRLTSYYNPYSG